MGKRFSFKKDDRYVWQWHYECFECEKNSADALHHIIASSNLNYVPGSHNGSIFNSAPLCNHTCHLGREAQLAKKIPEFLVRTLMWIESTDYERKQRDYDFIETYQDLYEQYQS